MNEEQTFMSFSSPKESTHQKDKVWIGVKVSHRQLFDTFQDEWFRPSDGNSGCLLGVCSYFSETNVFSGNQVPTYIVFDLDLFPEDEILVLRNGTWEKSNILKIKNDDDAIFWPGPIPASSITQISVKKSEEGNRLISLSHQVSNVSLPKIEIDNYHKENSNIPDPPYQKNEDCKSVFIDEIDSYRGALAMAIYTVPRIDPWLNLLVDTINADDERICFSSDQVGALWWCQPAWKKVDEIKSFDDLKTSLWKAAITTLGNKSEKSRSPMEIIDEIISLVPKGKDKLSKWRSETDQILRADKTINLSDWKENPVHKALQLFLLRPDPSRILTWFNDLPVLPPSVWWSAATLCGLFHGYKRLDSKYRGCEKQRQIFSLYSAKLNINDKICNKKWPGTPNSNLKWSRKKGAFFFNWGNIEFGERKEHASGLWYSSNFNDEKICKQAISLSKTYHWPCLNNEVSITDDVIKITGKGKLKTKESTPDITIEGKLTLNLPTGIKIEEKLNIEAFKYCIATEGIKSLPLPPSCIKYNLSPSQPSEITGLKYYENFIELDEERKIIQVIDKLPWRNDLKRRVQHYGWRYDYKARAVDESMRLGPLPNWASNLAKKLYETGITPYLADQVIVNEYFENQGISKHIDCVPCFEDGITMISLLESWEMVFTEAEGKGTKTKKQKVKKMLNRGSVTVLTGPSRYDWYHEIPKRLKEPGGKKRGRRVSLTFRKVKLSKK